MPRSKRAKVVHLSKVEKKGKDHTLKAFANIQAAVAEYEYIYVFSVENMRNTYLKDVRSQLSDSRLFFGKTKVMAKALGSSAATSPAPNTYLLSPTLKGAVGLLFSPRSPSAIQSYFTSFQPQDFARAGTVATRDFTIPAGVVYSTAGEVAQEYDVPLPHSMEPNVRQLGVPTRLVRGEVRLEEEYVVCRKGEILGSGQSTLLKLFGLMTAVFAVEVRAWWRRGGEVGFLGEEGGMDVDGKGDMDGVEDGDVEVDDGQGVALDGGEEDEG